MATLTLSDAEIVSIRREISLGITHDQVPDDAITDDLILGSATSYVLERVKEHMQTSGDAYDALSDAAKAAITAALNRDAADDPDEIAGFINNALTAPQRQQFRRGVLFRVAGLLIPKVSQILSESAGSISQRFQNVQWEVRQVNLFERVDEEIVAIRNAFPDDIFQDATPSESASRLGDYTFFAVN